MTFRPSPLAYALALLIAWTCCLALATGRIELFLAAVPLAIPLVRSPAPGRTQVADFQITADTDPFTEGEELPIAFSACLRGAPGPVEVRPVLPALLASSRHMAVVTPGSDGKVRWNCRVRCRAAGLLEVGTVFFRVWDKAGLWVGESRHEQRTVITAYPRVVPVQHLPAPSQTGTPFGIHLSRNVGDGTDFADIRRFSSGDRMKRINWAVSQRTRVLHVNQFYTERSSDIIILLDSFVNIGRRPDAGLDYCLRAAAGLARGYLRQYDRVGLMDYGGWIHWTRPAAGQTQYAVLLRALSRVTISPTDFIQDLAKFAERMLPSHASIIALTPLADERFAGMVSRLAEQGRDVILLALRTDEISGATTLRSAGGRLARRLWLLEREERLRELRGHGIRAVNWSPSLPLDAALVALPQRLMARRAS
jgi:uncharacterized protein (DUF58 family)